MYESISQPLLPWRRFVRRLLWHWGGAALLVLGSLLAGALGHVLFAGMGWHDSLLNTILVLGGIGPAELPASTGGKWFVGLYGLYVGLVFVASLGLLLAPLIHRLLHRLHRDE